MSFTSIFISIFFICLGAGAGYKHYHQHSTVAALSSIPGRGKRVLLTLDDGPCAQVTPKVLSVLQAEGIKAIFFVVGHRIKDEKARQVLQAICDQGHTLGNHSFEHQDMRPLSSRTQLDSIKKTHTLITRHQKNVLWFRPPGGKWNDGLLRVVKNQGMIPLFWSIDPQDWKKPYPTPQDLRDRVVKQACAFHEKRAYKMPIILLHDVYNTTAEGLQKMISGLRETGFSFVTPQEAAEILQNEGTCHP